MRAPAARRAHQDEASRSMGEVLDFMRLLWAVDHGLSTTSKRMAASMRITGPQRLVIRVVGRFPGIPAGRLAAILHVHPSTLTGVLGRLQRRGIVARRVDPSDRRRALLRLTARGRSLDAVRLGTVESAVRRTLVRAAPGDLPAARALLQSLGRELQRSLS